MIWLRLLHSSAPIIVRFSLTFSLVLTFSSIAPRLIRGGVWYLALRCVKLLVWPSCVVCSQPQSAMSGGDGAAFDSKSSSGPRVSHKLLGHASCDWVAEPDSPDVFVPLDNCVKDPGSEQDGVNFDENNHNSLEPRGWYLCCFVTLQFYVLTGFSCSLCFTLQTTLATSHQNRPGRTWTLRAGTSLPSCHLAPPWCSWPPSCPYSIQRPVSENIHGLDRPDWTTSRSTLQHLLQGALFQKDTDHLSPTGGDEDFSCEAFVVYRLL